MWVERREVTSRKRGRSKLDKMGINNGEDGEKTGVVTRYRWGRTGEDEGEWREMKGEEGGEGERTEQGSMEGRVKLKGKRDEERRK